MCRCVCAPECFCAFVAGIHTYIHTLKTDVNGVQEKLVSFNQIILSLMTSFIASMQRKIKLII